MKNVITQLAKTILILLGPTARALAADAGIQKKIFRTGTTTIVSNEELEDILKVFKSFEESGLSKKMCYQYN